ncbi:hypothetical protein [Sphingomicrobium nitratireducens]|uniref:hypothetical protein n=1 Tax=Sphingomicrobium nitratireducens TaxID=2964666 RepID=UPI0022406319|nr:hypothetical protein [Sphingomicrobium nitratireducens]
MVIDDPIGHDPNDVTDDPFEDSVGGGGIIAVVLLIVAILLLVFMFREELGIGTPTMEVDIPDRIDVEEPSPTPPAIDD